MSLHNKSMHQLRSIAQGMGVADIFTKSKERLIQDIELGQQDLVQVKPESIPQPPYDARLMTKPPAKKSNESDLMELLRPYVERGLTVDFPTPETWRMRWGKREDNGNMRMPLRHVLQCADKIMA